MAFKHSEKKKKQPVSMIAVQHWDWLSFLTTHHRTAWSTSLQIYRAHTYEPELVSALYSSGPSVTINVRSNKTIDLLKSLDTVTLLGWCLDNENWMKPTVLKKIIPFSQTHKWLLSFKMSTPEPNPASPTCVTNHQYRKDLSQIPQLNV